MCLCNKLCSLLQAFGGGVKAKKGWKKLTSYFIFFTNNFTLTTINAAVNSVSSSSFVLRRFQSILKALDLLYIWTYLSKGLTVYIQKY
jgi:hypothetical protein